MKAQRLQRHLVMIVLALLALVLLPGKARAATLYTQDASQNVGRGSDLELTLTARKRPSENNLILYRIRLYNADGKLVDIDNEPYYDITKKLSKFSSVNSQGYRTATAKFTMKTDNLALGKYKLQFYITYANNTAKAFETRDYEFSVHQHIWNSGVVTKEPTCTKDGIRTRTCTVSGCTGTKTEPIPALGHQYNDGVVTREPTWGKAGIKTYTCTRCGHTMTKKIPATGGPEKGTKFSKGSIVYEVKKKGKEVILTEDKKPKKAVVIPDTVKVHDLTYKVTAIGSKAYSGKEITSVKTGKNITKISFEAFRDCKKLEKVTLSKSKKLTFIGVNCFMGCEQLKALTIPASVKIISANAFRDCKALSRLYIKSAKLKASKLGKNIFKGTPDNMKVRVPKKQLKKYKTWLTNRGISSKAEFTGKY